MTYEQALSMIRRHKLVAILRGVPMELSLEVARALHRGGVRVLEFTFDHAQSAYIEKTAEQVRRVTAAFGDELLVGCGTVLTAGEVRAGQEAGANLMISPNVDSEVIRLTRKLDMVSMPGALTPTEIVNAHALGADVVKLFPAGVLGAGYIRAVRAPLSHIPMSAVGGVSPENVRDFLDAGVCSLGVGGEMVRKADLESGNMEALAQRAQAFVRAVQEWEEAHP